MNKLSKYFRFRTTFPSIEIEDGSIPDSEDTSCSDSDNSATRAKYSTKIDQDVQVFMEIAAKMSVGSLLFLLQNHAKTQLGIPDVYLNQKSATTSVTPKSATVQQPKPVQKIKKFRFAEVLAGEKVRAVVHEFPKAPPEDKATLWWTEEEMRAIRSEAVSTVRYFKRHRPDLTVSVAILSESYQDTMPASLVDEHVKKMSKDSYARGLETHIVPVLSQTRQLVVHSILEEQQNCQGQAYETSSTRIRERSVACTQRSRTLGLQMAKSDHIEALQSSLSRWRPLTPVATDGSGFFEDAQT